MKPTTTKTAEAYLDRYFASPFHVAMPPSFERAIELVYPSEHLVPQAGLGIPEAIAARRASLTRSEETARAVHAALSSQTEDRLPADQQTFLLLTSFYIGAAEFSEDWHVQGFDGIKRVLEVLDAVPVAVRYLRLVTAKAEYDHACDSLLPGERLLPVQLAFAREFARIFDVPEAAQPWDETGPTDLIAEYRRTGPSERHHARSLLSNRVNLLLIPLKDWAKVERSLEMDLQEFIYQTATTSEDWAAALRKQAA